MFPIGINLLSELLAAFAITILLTSYFTSSYEGEVDILISHRTLENVGLVLGVIYLVYAAALFATAIVFK